MFLQEEDILFIKKGSLLIDIKTEKLYVVERVTQRCIYFKFYSSGIWRKKSENKRLKTYIITYEIGNSYRIVPVSAFKKELEKKARRLNELEISY